ncbi:MAG: type II toxin-antitoxin system Phd/YefM family antitoxin, partial [Candidatus Thioglobus sp.]|nr:type II toxin-antitoxin system Phd/YefM family antitoxin [Candidatus Thioglobus sp.]MBT6278873.1 type II toxin-antitoxin system Phd/YefM family antitoxin [Candidatus Thioglobus sp.]
SLNFLKLIVQSEKEIETGDVIEQGKMFDELEQRLFK